MTDLVQHDGIDREAILRHLNLNPQDVNTQALLLICQRYELDPVMKHVVLISGRPYVTRDGYLHVAHRSGQLDGIEVLEAVELPDEWTAKVAVHRKDMGRPFTYVGRYPKSGQQKKYGPEMAIKTAEVMALRRAFDVTGIGAADEQWDSVAEAEPVADGATHEMIRNTVGALEPDQRAEFVAWYSDQQFPPIKTGDRLTERQAEAVLDRLDRYPSHGTIAEAEVVIDVPAVEVPVEAAPSAAARAALRGELPAEQPALGAFPKGEPTGVDGLLDAFPGSTVTEGAS